MKVVVLTGPESTGKSSLGRRLSERFGGLLVGEYVRAFIDQEQRDTCLSDIPAIAQGQLAWEEVARSQRPELLVLDTHLLNNMLWSQVLFQDCPAWLESELLSRHYDLHLLLSPSGVVWAADGQRCQPHLEERLAFFESSRHWLDAHQQAYEIIDGAWPEREATAMRAVAHLLGQRI